MDSDKALILGMLHDIGRRVGVTGMRHIIDGFTFTMEKGVLTKLYCLCTNRTSEDIIQDYTKLTDTEKTEILAEVNKQ